MARARICAFCKFFESYGENLAGGQCRRNPPRPGETGMRWPVVAEHEWCGEFRPGPEWYRYEEGGRRKPPAIKPNRRIQGSKRGPA